MNLNSLFADGDKQFRFSVFKEFPGMVVPAKLDASHTVNSKAALGVFSAISSVFLELKAMKAPNLGSVFSTY